MATVGSDAARSSTPDPADLGKGHDHPALANGFPHALSPSVATLTDAGELLRALAAPVRIAIVLQLRHGPRCVHELVDALEVTQPLISQHLRVLKAAGVVQGERRGREVVYHLVDDHLAHIVVDAVAHVQEDAQPV
ncbi:ArsR/SmtB family transcription factor [Saccharomonospora azurea]|uniref:Transcriptional regulator n=1 Tax=Saccharomonospora azurea NA-128 TaxID=882081 RepID=H8GFN2_9PSEU|nr:metalloregulator ArsR/SmtB family transcription factor [Saccharomonospora azurea]EHK86140.1 transcriptional regulator, ArsR family protein [Saccharomonospora azurea SZMC 14600]EHY91067.1 putative transcriptional regulator [Saccharomonospora azurea NA-128]